MKKIIIKVQKRKEDNKDSYFWISFALVLIWLLFDFGIIKWVAVWTFIDYLTINFWTMIWRNINIKNSVVFWNKEYDEDEDLPKKS